MTKFKKLGSVILLIISLLFVNIAWINVDVPGVTKVISKAKDLETLVETLGGGDIQSIIGPIEDLGLDLDLSDSQIVKDYKELRNALDDSKLSPVELKRVCAIAKIYGKKITTVVDKADDLLDLGIAESEEYEVFEDMIDSVVAFSTLYSLACGIFVVLAALAFIERIFGRRKILNILFFIYYVGAVALLFILLVAINDAYLETAVSVFATCNLSVTVAAVIGALLSFPLVVKVEDSTQFSLAGVKSSISGAAHKLNNASVTFAEKTIAGQNSNNSGVGFTFGAAKDTWTCPSCGNRNKDEYEFCSRCGSAKPKKPVCKNCGREIEENFVFCVYCGARVEKEKTDEPTAQAAEPEMKFCKFCGEKILASSIFCPCCGEKLN